MQKIFLFSKTSRLAPEPTQSPIQHVWGVFPREKWPEGKLTTFLQLGPRLRMSGAIILLLRAFMAQTRKALPILSLTYLLYVCTNIL